MLQLTDKAISKVKQLLAAEDKQGHALRIAVKGGGCAGFEYGLSFDEDRRPDDQILEFNGLTVYVDPMSRMYLDEVSVDYVEGLNGSGFKIENPKASGTCGCGNSFSV